jgi:hypothetical protein
MKHIMKLSFITAIVAVFGTTAAFADDQQLQNRLATQRAQAPDSRATRTVALYTNGFALGRTETAAQRSEIRFELRSNAHGQTFGAYAAIK